MPTFTPTTAVRFPPLLHLRLPLFLRSRPPPSALLRMTLPSRADSELRRCLQTVTREQGWIRRTLPLFPMAAQLDLQPLRLQGLFVRHLCRDLLIQSPLERPKRPLGCPQVDAVTICLSPLGCPKSLDQDLRWLAMLGA